MMGWTTIALVPVLIVFVVIGLPLLLGFLLLLAKILTGKKSGSSSAEETQLIQELYHGMTRLEERIGALESILIEHERAKEE